MLQWWLALQVLKIDCAEDWDWDSDSDSERETDKTKKAPPYGRGLILKMIWVHDII